MKTGKGLLSVFLALVLLLGLLPSVLAEDGDALAAADRLHELGLFEGVGTDEEGKPIYDLDRAPTRAEAITMLVRMLGKDAEAKEGDWELPFSDVADWARPYVGYAYANGLTKGVSQTEFGSSDPVSATQYLTFALRALGYDSSTDFQWDKAWELSDQIDLTHGEYPGTGAFSRGDVAVISLRTYELQQVLSTAPFFGLSAELRWIPVPKTVEDMDNNILYSFLFGKYELDFSQYAPYQSGLQTTEAHLKQTVKRLSLVYPELAGVFSNTTIGCEITKVGLLQMTFIDTTVDLETVYQQQQDVLQEALRVKAMLYEKGKIRDGMSQLQIAKAYESYLFSLNVTPGIGKKDPTCWESDSAYAALVKHKADCVGRAGAFNLLMNVEGIQVCGVSGSFQGVSSGHGMSRVVLDGEEYFSDWGNHRSLGSYEEYTKKHKFVFDADSLAYARKEK